MTSITSNVKDRVRTSESEHQSQNSISDPDQNLGVICIFSSGMQENKFLTQGKTPDSSIWCARIFFMKKVCEYKDVQSVVLFCQNLFND